MLENFNFMDTGHLDEARQIVGRRFCSHKLEILKPSSKFRARHNVVAGQLFSLNYLSYGDTVLIEPGELQHFYLLQIPLCGSAEISNGGLTFISNTQNGAILNPDRHTRVVWNAGCEQLLIYVPEDKLIESAESYLGHKIAHPIVFQPNLDFQIECLAHLRRSALMLAEGADKGFVFGKANAVNQALLEEKFLIDLLCFQPSNIIQLMTSLKTVLASKRVKYARDFIVENAHNSICLKQIAVAAGLPIRTLQHQFGHFYKMSPTEMLKRERLHRAYGELGSGHNCGSVASVASKWGFTHFGRFSQYFKLQFGELPSETKSKALKSRLML